MSSCENPNFDKDVLMIRRPKYDRAKTCVKCKTTDGSIVIRHAVYCKECFFPLVTARFKRTLEPYINAAPDFHRRKALRPAGNLTIGLSGGLGSTVLLDIIYKSYLTPRKQERTDQNPNRGSPWSRIFVVHVDISGALNKDCADLSEEIRALANDYDANLEFILLRIEDAFNEGWWKSVGGYNPLRHPELAVFNEALFLKYINRPSKTPLAALKSYLASLPTPTAVSFSIKTLVRVLLLYTATSTNSSHLVLGTSLTSLSISLISSISQGGGFTVREEAQEEWEYGYPEEECHTLRVIRPLREVGSKECAFWAWWCQLKIMGKPIYSGGRQDISAITKHFIVGLERDYPSTVSTIIRTCGKLTARDNAVQRCVFCERPAQPGAQQWRDRISIRSYQNPSATTIMNPAEDGDANTDTIDLHSLDSQLCYACHTTFVSRSIRGNQSSQMTMPVPVWMDRHLADTQEQLRSDKDKETSNIIGRYLLQ